MKKRDLLGMTDLTGAEVQAILNDAIRFKQERKIGKFSAELEGKTIGLIFEKPSTRTRVSFEAGISEMGGKPLFLSSQELQLSRGETISDTANTLSRYVYGIVARVRAHNDLKDLAKHSSVPVINALSNLEHPCQALADLQTIIEHKGKLEGVNVAWVGDGNNVCISLMLGCSLVGCNITIATPNGYEPPAEMVGKAQANAAKSGSKIKLVNDPAQAVSGADVVYTDVFTSMGMEAEREKRAQAFNEFQVNGKLMAQAKKDAIFMHCLPAHRGEEVAAEVIDGPQSVVFDQAENRLHAQKAVMAFLIAK